MGALDLFSLDDKLALVTGGAGLYGEEIATALSGAGARTIIASRDIETLEARARVHRRAERKVEALQYDQAEERSILRLRDGILERHDRIDVLVNNAVARPMKEGYRGGADSFAESMQTNATGLFLITRAIGDAMAEGGGGSIINVGSIQGMVGPEPALYRDTSLHGFYPDYFFHKSGMINFTRFIASYYGKAGVRCNCVSPGGRQTDALPETFVRQYSERTCLGRMAREGDLGGAIVFLASTASAYITGVNLPVDGGYTAK